MKKIDLKYQNVLPLLLHPNSKWPDGYTEGIKYVPKGFKVFGFDTETEGLSPYDNKLNLISIALSTEQGKAYGSMWPLNQDDLNKLREILTDSQVIIVAHNAKFDINWIALKTGIRIKCMIVDSMFAQYLLDENIESNSLGALAEQFEDLKGYKDTVDRNDLKRMAKDDVLIYNCKDADASRRLYDVFVPKLKTGGYDKLMTTSSMVLPVLSKMETRGIYLDKEYANKTQSNLFKELVSLRYTMGDIAQASFNPDSPQSLGNTLYKKLGFTPTKYTPTGSPSTDSEAIGYLVDQIDDEKQGRFLDAILAYKKKLKLITTYYQPIEGWTKYDGRVHTNYSLGRQRNEESSGGTVTGRLSSSNPNLQNIPRGKDHRGMFTATKGYTFLDGDFSQLELRVAAYLSQEPVMLDAFNNGLDIHTAVMSDLQGMPYQDIVSILKDKDCKEYEKTKNDRVAIKRINFGILYGVQAKRLQRLLRIELGITQDLEYCKEIINKWLSKYTKIRQWIETQKIQAVSYNYVAMPLGQRRRLPDASWERTREAAHALAQATNFPVQSLASWICLIGLILLDQYFEENKEIDGHIVLCVHDSVTSEISNQSSYESILNDVRKIMEKDSLSYIKDVFGVEFNCPLVFDTTIQERWA